MKTYRAFLGLGSNLGDRAKMLQAAADAVQKVPTIHVVGYSSVFETDPLGVKNQPKFLNAVAEIETGLEPELLVEKVKTIEKSLGRSSTERWGPREIDIDVLLYDGVVFKNDTLEVPHRGLPDRRFVLVPFREIAPDVVHPVTGLTIEELAKACADRGRVVKTSFVIH